MTEALLILNPREIPDCITALRALPIPKLWISYMGERRAATEINHAVNDTTYDRYVIVSDDTTPTPEALAAVLDAQSLNGTVATGYCNLDAHLPYVNLTRNTLPKPPPGVYSYKFLTRDEVDQGPVIQPTTFAGLALTCVSRDLLLKHPMTVSTNGGQMDYMLSYSLQQARVPIITPRAGFIHHVKELWNSLDQAPEKRLLVGHHPPSVTWTDV